MSSETNDFDFSGLTWKSTEVILPGGGKYVLREASAEAVRQYRRVLSEGMRIQDQKVAGMSSVGELETVLVAACLFPNTKDGVDDHPVSPDFVRGLQNRIVSKLYSWVRQNSDMGDDAGEKK